MAIITIRHSLSKAYCHSGSLKHRATITTQSPIIATTLNAITYSIFVHLFCFTEEARRPQHRAAASALQDNPDGPTDRTGNRAPRSEHQLHLLSECDARCQPADSRALERHSTHRNIRSLSE